MSLHSNRGPGRTEQKPLREILAPIGEAVDRYIEALPLWKHNRATALYYLLTAFEDSVRLPLAQAMHGRNLEFVANSDGARMNLEFALTCAVRLAYKLCPPPLGAPSREPFDWDTYGEAANALKLARDYDTLVACLENAVNGRYRVCVTGRSVEFSLPSDNSIDYEAISYLAMRERRDPRPHPFSPLALQMSPGSEEMLRSIAAATRITGDTSISYGVPASVESYFFDLAQAAMRDVELPLDVNVAGYSLREFLRLYRHLYKCAAMHQTFCWASVSKGQPGHGVASIVLGVNRSSLRQELVGGRLLSSEAFTNIVNDLTYDSDLRHTDIYFQPLLEVAPDQFLISPLVITASKWQRNLERLWALRYSDLHSAQLGPIKFRLAETLADSFARRGLLAEANRPLREPDRGSLTDVDLAVFDRAANALLVGEVKWLTEPAEAREVRRADDELAKGIAQARAAADYVRAHRESAAALLFPRDQVRLTHDTTVLPVVIGRNHIGSRQILAPDVPIWDYAIVQSYLPDAQAGKDLISIAADLSRVLRLPRRGQDYRPGISSFEFAGYQFRAPVFSMVAPPDLRRVRGGPRNQPGRNAPCPCGSGRKYKRCHGGSF